MELITENGKPVKPSKGKQIMATLKGDDKLTIVFSYQDVQGMVVDTIFSSTPWISKYNWGSLRINPDGTFTVEFSK